MRHRYTDSLIVEKTSTNPAYGIVTTIDISDKIVAQGKNPAETKIRELMAISFDHGSNDNARLTNALH